MVKKQVTPNGNFVTIYNNLGSNYKAYVTHTLAKFTLSTKPTEKQNLVGRDHPGQNYLEVVLAASEEPARDTCWVHTETPRCLPRRAHRLKSAGQAMG